jgi:Arc/MetJ-type ribon-helix-helix transcriptional regulator
MSVAKLSVSVDESLVAFVDRYQKEKDIKTKSEVVEKALKLLRSQELKEAYKEAYREWRESGEEAVWEVTVADGLDNNETW